MWKTYGGSATKSAMPALISFELIDKYWSICLAEIYDDMPPQTLPRFKLGLPKF